MREEMIINMKFEMSRISKKAICEVDFHPFENNS